MMSESYKYETVLLVDDSHIDSMISSKILKSSHYAERVLIIPSPQKAIDFIRESVLFQTDIPEVLFLDLRMPEMNGFDFLKELDIIEGFAYYGLEIYVLSSSLDPKDYHMIRQNKLISKFIGKPLTSEILESI
ncbi:MAG TPA: response regulator [Sphingobacteriaceae bacterium]|nr:response regulator [Sphingobacteriaceae bacterium]